MSPLQRDLSDLPKAATARDGNPPDPHPRFVQILVEGWADLDGGEKPRAFDDTRFRHSDAGKCARAIAYAALDLPASDPMDLSGTWNTRLGTLIHEAWQEALAERFPDAEIEPKIRTDAGSGHADAVVRVTDPAATTTNGQTTSRTSLIELKSVGGFAFKMAVGERGAAEGPKHEHVVQAALNGLAVDADEIVIAYLSKEAISVNVAARKKIDELGRFCAEWTFTRDEYMPIALAEIDRVTGILRLLDEGTLPKRTFPAELLPFGAEIIDPKSGRWEIRRDSTVTDVGTWWACGYCRYQSLCARTEPGRVPVEVVIRGAA